MSDRAAQRLSGLRLFSGSSSLDGSDRSYGGRRRARRVGLSGRRWLRDGCLLWWSRLHDVVEYELGGREPNRGGPVCYIDAIANLHEASVSDARTWPNARRQSATRTRRSICMLSAAKAALGLERPAVVQWLPMTEKSSSSKLTKRSPDALVPSTHPSHPVPSRAAIEVTAKALGARRSVYFFGAGLLASIGVFG